MRFWPSLPMAVAIGLSLACTGTTSVARSYPKAAASNLGPGQYSWHPERARSGRIAIRVRLKPQLVYVYRSDTLIGMARVSTGKANYRTPTGSFRILQKERHHRSNRYDNAPMPYMMRLSWRGLAMHGGHNPGYPASHGCIRLPMAFAAKVYAAAPLGASVTITG
jgi:hypothetical protein